MRSRMRRHSVWMSLCKNGICMASGGYRHYKLGRRDGLAERGRFTGGGTFRRGGRERRDGSGKRNVLVAHEDEVLEGGADAD